MIKAVTDDPLSVLYDHFVEFEKKNDAHRVTVSGVRVWSANRSELFRKAVVRSGLMAEFQSVQPGYRGSTALAVRNTVFRNPFFIGHKENALFKWERVHGGEGDPISSAIAREFTGKGELVQFEAAGNPVLGSETFSLDAVSVASKIRSSLGRLRLSLSEQNHVQDIVAAFQTEFDVRLDKFFEERAARFVAREATFFSLLRRTKVKRIFIVVAYAFPEIVAAALRAKIRVVELQHGLIFRSHTGYDFPEGLDPAYRPDEIWLFGKHWCGAARHNRSTELKVWGAPHIRKRIDEHLAEAVGRRQPTLLVVSQPAIGSQLLRFCVDLVALPDTPPIVFRLHPSEDVAHLKELIEAAHLPRGRLELSFGGGGIRTMELQARVRWQMGVFSTAVVEGAALGCKTLIVNIAGWSALQSLVDDNIATLVDSPESAAYALRSDNFTEALVDPDRFFARGAKFSQMIE